MKKFIIVSAVVILVLICTLVVLSKRESAVHGAVSEDKHWADILQMNQTSTAENDENYSGLLSGIRTGGYRNAGSLGNNEFECTDNGVYFNWVFLEATHDGATSNLPYLFYADHNSDSVIKLCGRPDCTHNTTECNAVFPEGDCGISYYGGHLYLTTYGIGPEIMALYRMDPDGNNRTKILDCSGINEGQYSHNMPPYVLNGVLIVQLMMVEDVTGETIGDYFYYKLDGSMDELTPISPTFIPEGRTVGMWTDGEAFLFGTYTYGADGGVDSWQLNQWDPDTNTTEILATVNNAEENDMLIQRAYWGVNNGLAHLGGEIVKIQYPSCELEVLFETGIACENTVRFYPDCIAIHERISESSNAPDILHFYRYNGEKVGEVVLDIPNNAGGTLILGESRDIIYLGSNFQFRGLPNYYIDKAEFGTDNLELHPLQHPDLTENELEALFNGGAPFSGS